MRLSKVEDVAGTSAIINKVDEETFYISRWAYTSENIEKRIRAKF